MDEVLRKNKRDGAEPNTEGNPGQGIVVVKEPMITTTDRPIAAAAPGGDRLSPMTVWARFGSRVR